MTWQCAACDTINDLAHPACAVCDLDRATAEQARAAKPSATSKPAMAAKPLSAAAPPLPPRSPTPSVIPWIIAVILVIAAGATALVVLHANGDGSKPSSSASSSGGSSSSTETHLQGLTLKRRSYDAFSVDVPTSWKVIEKGVDHGAYIETEWGSPAHDTVYAKVDYTPGFSGTPRSGAAGVRGLYTGLERYHEFGYAEYETGDGKAGWRWSFVYKGVRKVDSFFTGCGTGYALLGAAPPDLFQRYEPIFEHMAQSLRLTC
jgi:hypothetical protein